MVSETSTSVYPLQEEKTVIGSLIDGLNNALVEKSKLDVALTHKCEELQQKISELEMQNHLPNDVNKVQASLPPELHDVADEHLLLELNQLKVCYYNNIKEYKKNEKQLAETLNELQTKEADLVTTKEEVLKYQNKYLKYKSKVKYAIDVIKVITSELNECKKTAKVDNKECQTKLRGIMGSFICKEDEADLENENIMLRQLFFLEADSVDTVFDELDGVGHQTRQNSAIYK